MPAFTYTAINATGQQISGTMSVGSRAEAFRKLEAQALTPVRVAEEVKSAAALAKAAQKQESLQPVKLKRQQRILFTEERADLLDA